MCNLKVISRFATFRTVRTEQRPMLQSLIVSCQRLSPIVRVVSCRTLAMSSPPSIRPIVVSGPSGSGKSTLLKMLFDEFPNSFCFSVSHTTRQPRMGEIDGKDYHFVTRDAFERLIAENGFLEHAEFSGNRYGTSKKSVNDITKSGKICVLDVEINGVKNIKKADIEARYIFIRPPSLEVLEKRLRDRGTETEESLQKRLNTVKEALEYAEANNYDFVIVNNVKETAYTELRAILQQDIDALTPNK